MMATAGRKDNDGAALDTKGRGAEVISVEGNDTDCGADAGPLLAVVVWL